MSWTLRDQEMEAVLKIGAAERYEHLIKRAADCEQVWTSRLPGGAVGVWPHERYGRHYLPASAELRTVALADWMRALRDGTSVKTVAAFPAPGDQGLLMEPARMRADLARYLEEWFGVTEDELDMEAQS